MSSDGEWRGWSRRDWPGRGDWRSRRAGRRWDVSGAAEAAAARPRPPRLLLTLVVAVVQVIGCRVAAAHDPAAQPLDAIAYALLVAGPVALLARRRWPLPVLGVVLAVTLTYLAAGYAHGPYALAAVVAVFAVARRAPRFLVWTLVGVAYAAYVTIGALWTHPSLGTYVATAVWTAVALVLAEAARVRSIHFAEMRQAMAQAEQAKRAAERARQEQTRRQASDERLRIARELHDVLGHHLSLINMRAGVALHLLDTRPAETREALEAIKHASAEALREVRGVLATLRPDDDEAAPRAPAPGLADVEALGADLAVTFTRDGPARALPPEVDRAAYRIVQEALTNVRRHAGPEATVTVALRYEPAELTLRVDDTGAGGIVSTSDGNGIPGMRERAAALGGRLAAGPRAEGGFRVEAVLPLADDGVPA